MSRNRFPSLGLVNMHIEREVPLTSVQSKLRTGVGGTRIADDVCNNPA